METPLKGYEISLKIVNYVESLIIERIGNELIFLKPLRLFPLKKFSLPPRIHKIYNWVSKKIFWLFQTLIKPIAFILYGIGSTIKKYYIIFIVVFSFYFLINTLINKLGYVEGITFNKDITLNILFSIFIIIALFCKIPPHGEKENNLIRNLTEKLISYNLNESQWKLISENINIYKEYFDKRTTFINSILAFGCGSYLLIFKISSPYFSKDNISMIEIFNTLFKPFLCYIVIFTFIRAYIKVYRFIFEMIKISLNEIFFLQLKNE